MSIVDTKSASGASTTLGIIVAARLAGGPTLNILNGSTPTARLLGPYKMAPSSQDIRPPLVDSSPQGRSNIEAGPEQPPSVTNTESTPLLSRSAREKSSNTHYRDISGPRFIILFLSIIFGATLAFFDSTLMASSHPVITSYFHASNAASWLSTVFYLSSTVFQPLYGRVSDTIGRRPVVFFAAVMFFASTAWCAFAGSIGSFIAARAVCGLGAGGVMSMASILTSDVVKIEYRGIYQSYFNMVCSRPPPVYIPADQRF